MESSVDEIADALIGDDRPAWVEPTHPNYTNIAAHYLRHRGRSVDAEALLLLRAGRKRFFTLSSLVCLVLGLQCFVAPGTPEHPFTLHLRFGLFGAVAAAVIAVTAVVSYRQYSKAKLRLQEVTARVVRDRSTRDRSQPSSDRTG